MTETDFLEYFPFDDFDRVAGWKMYTISNFPGQSDRALDSVSGWASDSIYISPRENKTSNMFVITPPGVTFNHPFADEVL